MYVHMSVSVAESFCWHKQQVLKSHVLAHFNIIGSFTTAAKTNKSFLNFWRGFFFLSFFCLVFAMPLCASVYMCLVVTSWERADILALVCGV